MGAFEDDLDEFVRQEIEREIEREKRKMKMPDKEYASAPVYDPTTRPALRDYAQKKNTASEAGAALSDGLLDRCLGELINIEDQLRSANHRLSVVVDNVLGGTPHAGGNTPEEKNPEPYTKIDKLAHTCRQINNKLSQLGRHIETMEKL